MSVLTTTSMDYAKSARFRGQSRHGNWLISIGKSAIVSRPNAAVKLSIRTFADNTLLARQARKVTTKIVLLQSYRNDLCLLLLFTFICFLHFFFLEFNLFVCMQWNYLSRYQNKKSILFCTSIIDLFYNSLTLSIMC